MNGISLTCLALLASLAVAGSGRSLADEPSPHRLDHVGFGMADLDEATRIVAERTGVEPAYGGEHPHLGTHNALLSLGDGRYFEVIGVRPDAEGAAGMASWLGTLDSLTGVLWAIASDDVEATRRLLAEAGFETSEPQPGSRETPNGKTLEWQTFGLTGVRIPGAPFFIRWSEGVAHPSSDSPTGCTLAALTVTTPAAAELSRVTEALGLADVTVRESETASIGVELDCPKGRVSF